MMNRIVLHHTGGPHRPTADDRRAYHRIVDVDGLVYDGRFPIEANAPGRLRAGAYAAHCRGLNTGSIGLAMACMGDAVWASPRAGKWFPTPAQVSAFYDEAARLALRYGIPCTPKAILTHAEVQPRLGVFQKNKWDFDYALTGPIGPRNPLEVGEAIRSEISLRMGASPEPTPKPVPARRPTLRRGDTGPAVRELQAALGVTVDGAFGPATDAALRKFQRLREMLPDGIAGPQTWAALQVSP